jgi:hypothetical protein
MKHASPIFALLTCSFVFSLQAKSAHAAPLRSDFVPENHHKNTIPWMPESLAPFLNSSTTLGGFDELVPYVLPSPNQEDAGSCLYMATTGIAEWWLARLNPHLSRKPNGPIDLSERYLMNIAGIDENETKLENWRTDSIYLFNNNTQKSYLNKDYPYTKGWYKSAPSSNNLEPALPNESGAEYGTSFNWISQLNKISAQSVKLPQFHREVIFADPENNQWNIGVAPSNIVETVKAKLIEKRAPVLVIYNHHSYWHAVYIIGFNDTLDNGNCAYTERFRERVGTRTVELEEAARNAKTEEERKTYEQRAQRSREAQTKIETAYQNGGGCISSKGVFYIRDSIYPDENGPVYDYDPSQTGEEGPYTKKIVFKEYDWLRYFANHVAVITVQ